MQNDFLLRDWFVKHQRLMVYMQFEQLNGLATAQMRKCFSEQRTANNTKLISVLSVFLAELDKKCQKKMQEITKIIQIPYLKTKINIYDDNRDNMLLHRYSFAKRTEYSIKLYLMNLELKQLNEKVCDAKDLIKFYQKPDNVSERTICKLSDSFFRVNKTEEIQITEKHILSIQSYIVGTKKRLKNLEKPLWISNFSKFFTSMLSVAQKHFDKVLSYALPNQIEVSFSRCTFSGLYPQLQQEIDAIVNNTDKEPEEFVTSALKRSLQLIPDCSERKPNEQSIGLMIFFRLIFDRLYETNYQAMFKQDNNIDPLFLYRVSKLPLRLFHLSIDFRNESKPNESIHDFFNRDHFFNAASQFISEIIFFTNPVDCLYYVHRSLLAINKAALMRRVLHEATLDDINRLLCFDDLFSLLVGTVLACDLPDFFMIANFIRDYSPQGCLSNPLEYAQAGITALIMHFSGLDIDLLESMKDDGSVEVSLDKSNE